MTTFFIGLLVNQYAFANVVVPTGSMIPTIKEEDRLVSNYPAYLTHLPERGDIVVFLAPDKPETMYIKRIIGLPGETVNIVDGKVYIDGSKEVLEEPYLTETPTGSFGPFQVPEGHYFMMGDNRNHSWDSRYWANTYVPLEDIQSKAMFVYYPHPRILK